MAASLDKWENKLLFHHRHMVKRLRTSRDNRRNTSNHFVNTQRYFDSPVLHQNYWTDLQQNFARYSGISDAI